jgi:precorrin-6B methylase 1
MIPAVSSITIALVRLRIAASITATISSLRRCMSKRRQPSR